MIQFVSYRALYGETYQKKEWRHLMDSEPLYELSCLAPFFMAFIVAVRLHDLSVLCPWFPWHWFTFCLLLQGIATYQGDVATFGVASWWKVCDVWLALVNMVCFAAFAAFPVLGWSSWSCLSSLLLAVSLVLALWFKHKATQALINGKPELFFHLHALWHWLLLFGSVGALSLLQFKFEA